MKRGFTLIELMVVISIIAVLTSVLFIRVSLAQSKARDNTRIQQIHQIDLATRLYTEQNQHAPYLTAGNLCAAQSRHIQDFEASACFTISTSGDANVQANWNAFKTKLIDGGFIKNIPNDPCSNCSSGSDYDIGYTYVPPLVFQYQCQLDFGVDICPLSESELNNSYQVYTALEQQSSLSGNSTNESVTYYNPPSNQDTTSPSIPTGVNVQIGSIWIGGAIPATITWNESTDASGIAGYSVTGQGYIIDGSNNHINEAGVISGTTRTRYLNSATYSGTNACYSVKSYDNSNNSSADSSQICSSVPFAISTPAGFSVNNLGGNTVRLSWPAPVFPSDAINKKYTITGYTNVTTPLTTITVPFIGGGCWNLRAVASTVSQTDIYISDIKTVCYYP